MELSSKIAMLYDKDSSLAYENLQELEELSEANSILYSYFDKFLNMLENEKYTIRVRGFRLLCKQAKWDEENKIDKKIDIILKTINDEKPTAVRQKLKALENIARYKKSLRPKIKDKVLSIDYLEFKDTMQNLIQKDIKNLLQIIEDK